MPSEQEGNNPRGQFRVSPDGKYLYQFGQTINIYDTTDFKLTDKIELSKPQYAGMEGIFLSPGDDPHDAPGKMSGVFNSTDPVVHRPIFGIAEFDLNKRTFDFTPVGPSPNGMTGFRMSPDRKMGYTVAISGIHGMRRCEFWSFDMTTKKVISRGEFPGLTRFQFSISSDGKYLYIYGAGFTIDAYDAKTFQHVNKLDVAADMTTALVVLLPNS